MLKSSRTTQLLLSAVAVLLGCNLLNGRFRLESVQAQSANADPLYIEPGSYMMPLSEGARQMGKIVINLRTGAVYGFPTGGSDPFPVSPLDGSPQTSHAVPLGRFALSETQR